MDNSFSFTLIENTENTTEVMFLDRDLDLIEFILDSYDFEYHQFKPNSVLIHESIETVFNDLTDFEESDSQLLTEEDEGFYISPLDDVFEIVATSVLTEGTAKRTVAVRGGKRKIIFKCQPGQMKVGRTCRRRPTSQLVKMKRRARITARKSKRKRKLANRKRKISLRRRAVLVRKKPHK